MRTKIKVLLLSVFIFFSVFLVSVNAEENEVVEGENVEEVVEEVLPSKTITFNEQLQDFLDKWLTPIISALSGAGGSLTIILMGLKFIKAWKKKIEENSNLTDEQKKESIERLNIAEEKFNKAQEQLSASVKNQEEVLKKATEQYQSIVDKMQEQYNALLEKFNIEQEHVTKFKQLVALLISSNPDLASNGIATQILVLLDDGNKVVEGVDYNEQE